MIRPVIISALILSGAYFFTTYKIGYNRAGSGYVKKISEERKSIRAGSGYYTPVSRGTGSFRSGK